MAERKTQETLSTANIFKKNSTLTDVNLKINKISELLLFAIFSFSSLGYSLELNNHI